MSKERELLKEALKVLEWNGMDSHHTYNSIKELLAQNECGVEFARRYKKSSSPLVTFHGHYDNWVWLDRVIV